VYAIKNNIKYMFNIKNKKKEKIITYFLSLSIPLLSVYLFKTYDLNNLIKYTPYVIGIFYIALIIFFIRSLFIKTKSS